MIDVINYTEFQNWSSVLEFAIKKLGFEDVKVIIQVNDDFLDKYGNKTLKAEGLIYQTKIPTPPTFNLVIRKETEKPLPLLFCHEAVHLAQYLRGDLVIDLENKIFIWKGKKFSFDCDYKNRPWEIEAFNLEEKLYNEYRKENKKSHCLLNLFKR